MIINSRVYGLLVVFVLSQFHELLIVRSQCTTLSQCIEDVTHPQTTVALTNTNSSFICCYKVAEGFFPPELKINGNDANEDDRAILEDRGITWKSILSPDDNTTVIGFKITINATVENNNTSIRCTIHPFISDEAYLYVVNTYPFFEASPVADLLNSTSINVSWSPLWTYPVQSYTLIVHNDITNLSTNYSTNSNNYIIHKDVENDTNCSQLEFSVVACTDLGATQESAATITGFPKDLNFTSLNTSIEILSQSSMNVSIESPSFCEFETLEYAVEILVNNHSLFLNNYDGSNIMVNSSKLVVDCPAEYEFSFTIRNQANQETKWSVLKNVMCPSPSILASGSKKLSTIQLIAILSSFGGGLVISCLVSILTLSLCLFGQNRKSAVKQNRASICSTAGLILPHMEMNDQYDSYNEQQRNNSNHEVVYETLSLNGLNDAVQNSLFKPQSKDEADCSREDATYAEIPIANCDEDEYIEMTKKVSNRASVSSSQMPRYALEPQLQMFSSSLEQNT